MVHGIHHITAIASDPQRCFDFYTKVLGLRLTKKSINQDQVEAYHLFFGDSLGDPGMDLTFFTFSPALPSIPGTGVVSRVSLAISTKALSFWRERLTSFRIPFDSLSLHALERLRFYDPDGLALELVAVDDAEFSKGVTEVWETQDIHATSAIGYFYSATLTVASRMLIEPTLLFLGYRILLEDDRDLLFTLSQGDRAVFLAIEERPTEDEAVAGSGSVHHIAFSVDNEKALYVAQEALVFAGFHATAIIDRHYFKSVYFRTAAGILFELATMDPGFTIDEDPRHLGEKLSIPPFLENKRAYIEALLPEITS